MKSKDIIGLAILGVILAIVGTLLLGNVGGGQPRTAEVEVVRPITPEFNSEASSILRGGQPDLEVDTFSAPLNLDAGFGNQNPFRQ